MDYALVQIHDRPVGRPVDLGATDTRADRGPGGQVDDLDRSGRSVARRIDDREPLAVGRPIERQQPVGDLALRAQAVDLLGGRPLQERVGVGIDDADTERGLPSLADQVPDFALQAQRTGLEMDLQPGVDRIAVDVARMVDGDGIGLIWLQH